MAEEVERDLEVLTPAQVEGLEKAITELICEELGVSESEIDAPIEDVAVVDPELPNTFIRILNDDWEVLDIFGCSEGIWGRDLSLSFEPEADPQSIREARDYAVGRIRMLMLELRAKQEAERVVVPPPPLEPGVIEQGVFDNVAEQLFQPRESVRLESNLRSDLNADALDLTELIMALEETFVREIDVPKRRDSGGFELVVLDRELTVGGLIELLKAQLCAPPRA
ncbi:MAG: hypothetical protein H6718_22825 [Polyangiaceae bacterium]|nr:hypothetical protein [Polyangiaceae bacterium]